VFSGVAAEELRALKVGLLECDETKNELEDTLFIVVEQDEAVARQLIIVIKLQHVRLAE
jgi:hypothetical protein